MSLPLPPLLQGENSIDIAIIYEYLYTLIRSFDNATGQAIDPTQGQGGAGALSIVSAPSNITYTPSSSLAVDGTLFGQINITFTLPARAIGVLVSYKEHSESMYHTSITASSPTSIVNLKVGTQYDITLSGQAANGSVGPASPIITVSIPTTLLTTSAPSNLVAVPTYQSIVLTWTGSVGGIVAGYEVEVADDAAFTVNNEVYRTAATYFILDTGIIGSVKFIRVRGISGDGSFTLYANTVTDTTLNVPDDSIITVKILDDNITTAKIADDAVTTVKVADGNITYAKIQTVTDSTLLGRGNSGNGEVEEISIGSHLLLSGTTLDTALVIASGTYTPTDANSVNLSTVSHFICQYLRVGNVVTVSGRINLTATVTGTATSVDIAIPFASNFTSNRQCGGVGACSSAFGEVFTINANLTADLAHIAYVSGSTAALAFWFTFTYLIL